MYRFLSLCYRFFIISRIAQDLGDHFPSFPEWSGFRRSCFIIPRRVEDLGIIPVSLPEWSWIRDIEHTQAAKISPSSQAAQHPRLEDPKIWGIQINDSKCRIAWIPKSSSQIQTQYRRIPKSRSQSRMQNRRIRQKQVTDRDAG